MSFNTWQVNKKLNSALKVKRQLKVSVKQVFNLNFSLSHANKRDYTIIDAGKCSTNGLVETMTTKQRKENVTQLLKHREKKVNMTHSS